MIRILHVIRKMDFGGAETLLMNIYRNIDRKAVQFDFAVQTNEKGLFDDEIESLGGRIFHIPDFYVTNFLQYRRFWNKFLQEHPEYKIIHGHVNSSAAVYLSCAKRNKRIAIVHSHATRGRINSLRSLMFLIFSYPIRYIADYFYGCSLQAGIDRFGSRVAHSDRFSVLNNGIQVEKFEYNAKTREKIRKELNIDDATYLLGHVGRFQFAKNHDFLIDVFSELHKREPQSKLLLIGDGELRKPIQKKVEDLGLVDAVIFGGLTDKVHEYLQAMDCFVFPSIFEGLGISLIEAQTAGLPCIVSDAIVDEADIKAGLIVKHKLTDSPAIWADTIQGKKHHERRITTDYIRSAGFDIKDTANILSMAYMEKLNL